MPGDSFYITVIRNTYVGTSYKELVQEEEDFPFTVEFSIEEEEYNFDDYFTVSFNPQLGNKSHTITVKRRTDIIPVHSSNTSENGVNPTTRDGVHLSVFGASMMGKAVAKGIKDLMMFSE